MGKGAHLRYLEACFHYPEVAEFSMDPSQVYSCALVRKHPIRGSGPKCAVSKTPFLPLAFHLPFSPSITIWAGSFPDPRGYPKVMALCKLIDIFPIGRGVTSPLCFGKDRPCLIECLTWLDSESPQPYSSTSCLTCISREATIDRGKTLLFGPCFVVENVK